MRLCIESCRRGRTIINHQNREKRAPWNASGQSTSSEMQASVSRGAICQACCMEYFVHWYSPPSIGRGSPPPCFGLPRVKWPPSVIGIAARPNDIAARRQDRQITLRYGTVSSKYCSSSSKVRKVLRLHKAAQNSISMKGG